MKYLKRKISNKLVSILKTDYEINPGDVQFSIPSDRKFGDLSTTIPFVIARRIQEKPRVVGEAILKKIKDGFDMFSEIKLAGGGFLNFRFKKDFLLSYLLENQDRQPEACPGKVIVEHTSINPNKSAHIGHLRNSCLGDTLNRALRFLGYRVEVQNYIDDTGVQVADVVWGLLVLRKLNLRQIREIKNLAHYLWDLYSRVHQMVEEQGDITREIREVLKKIENKQDPEYSVSDYISREVLRNHIQLMEIAGIQYDLLVRESDIIELDFFTQAAEILKKNRIMYPSGDPEKEGCWVIRYDLENIEKIVIRSDQTVTYIGKDIAYALWKMGLLPGDFYYEEFYRYPDQHPLQMTRSESNELAFDFGHASRVYNVIGKRQSYLQNIISQVLDALESGNRGQDFVHFSYEMVALTPRCVQEMGFELTPELRTRAHIDVSGRKGIAVKADELMEKLTEKSREEVLSRNPDMKQEATDRIARQIAMGALRYFMVKFNSNSVITFDFQDALTFEGDTGPYLQYTLVRLNSIFKKIGSQADESHLGPPDLDLLDEKELTIYHELLLHISLLDSQIEFALDSSELSVITSYTYVLCQKCNHYYHRFSILAEKNPQVRQLRLSLIGLIRKKLEVLFEIIGIPVPERM
jgi:arginyl-tRNA synthetase